MLTKNKQHLIYAKLLIQKGHKEPFNTIIKNIHISKQDELIDLVLFLKADKHLELSKSTKGYEVKLTRQGLGYLASFDKGRAEEQKNRINQLHQKTAKIKALEQQLKNIDGAKEKEFANQKKNGKTD